MTAIINVKDISKKINEYTIFQNISFTIQQGECVGLIGHNGSGKTMIMKALCGFITIDAGEIIVNKKDIVCGKKYITDAGVLIEAPIFLNRLTGYENLAILANIQKKITQKSIINALQAVGLQEAINKKVGTYSLGMKQKLRIAQAIMEQPAILILDEPFNGLDKASVEMLQSLLKDYQNNGTTILLTTHDDRQIATLCNRVYELDNGRML